MTDFDEIAEGLAKSARAQNWKLGGVLTTDQDEATDAIAEALRNAHAAGVAEKDAEIARLRAALRRAREDMEAWAAYVDEYSHTKHGLSDDLAAIDAALAKEPSNG